MIEEIVRDVALDLLRKKMLAALISQFSFFAFPPLSWVASFFLNKFINFLREEDEFLVEYGKIHTRVSNELIEAISAKDELEKAIESGVPDAISKSKENFKDKYSKLVSYSSRK